MENISKVIEICSGDITNCPECDTVFRPESITEGVNHLLNHGYKLLHIGTQTSRSSNGELWHSTVAILGEQ